jgi:hypothetical protein
VTENAKGERLLIGEWYLAGAVENDFTSNKPIEDICIQKEDHIRLTVDVAAWIAHYMDVDKITKDPTRKESFSAFGKRSGTNICTRWTRVLTSSSHTSKEE